MMDPGCAKTFIPAALGSVLMISSAGPWQRTKDENFSSDHDPIGLGESSESPAAARAGLVPSPFERRESDGIAGKVNPAWGGRNLSVLYL